METSPIFASDERMPIWVRKSLAFGERFFQTISKKRRIAILSLPRNAPIPGLIALGALCSRLSETDAGDLEQHFYRIKASINQTKEVSNILRNLNRKGRFKPIDYLSEFNLVKVKLLDGNGSVTVNEKNCSDWYFEEEGPVISSTVSQLSNLEFYSQIFPELNSNFKKNIQKTDSAICISGQAAGRNKTFEYYEKCKFDIGGNTRSLLQLLPIANSPYDAATRINYFNPRTRRLERNIWNPRLVVADGRGSLLEVLRNNLFEQSDVIGTYSRCTDRENLEELFHSLQTILQWSEIDKAPNVRFESPNIYQLNLIEL